MADPAALALAALLGALASALALWLAALGPARRAAAEAGTRAAVAETRSATVDRLEQEAAEARQAARTAEGEASALRARLASETEAHQARLDELRRMEAEMERRFHDLASRALSRNAETFLTQVSERFSTHKAEAQATLDERQKAIEGLVSPLKETLGRFEAKVGELEQRREGAYHAIREQVEALRQGHEALGAETRRLVQALRAPKARGRWGELQLRQVFEMAGMVEHVDFALEQTVETDDGGRLRPDAVVRMPGGRSIVVDAKTPLDAYLDLVEATEPEAQRTALENHARQLRAQVQGLSKKEYWARLEGSPDFVVMFVPGEAIYSAAMQTDPGLFEDAFRNRVLIATPTTLIALVKAIAYGWHQEKLAENAREVAEAGKALYERLGVLGGHVSDLGKSLRQSVERYNRTVGSLEGRVLPAARRFEDLGIAPPEASLEGPGQVETEPRALNAPELTAELAPSEPPH